MDQRKDKETIILEAIYQIRLWESEHGKVNEKWKEVTKLVNSNGVALSKKTIINNFNRYLTDFRRSDKLEIIQSGFNQIESEKIKMLTELSSLFPERKKKNMHLINNIRKKDERADEVVDMEEVTQK